MRTLALLSQKGGTGKTTLAIHLAVWFQRQEKNVLLLDLDPQASAAEWHDARTERFPHVESIQPSRLARTVEHAKSIGTDILILDTAPHSESATLDAARIADLILIPCQPSIMDLRAMAKTVDLIKLVKVPAFAVLNGVQRSSIGAATEAEKTIQRVLRLSVCPARISERVAFNRCLITGQSAEETEPEGKAARETVALGKWAARQLDASPERKAA